MKLTRKYFAAAVCVTAMGLAMAGGVARGAAAPYSRDSGRITRVYVTPSGSIALQIDGGFRKANEDGQCPRNNGWAGVVDQAPSSALQSAILSAYLAGRVVSVVTAGCTAGGDWLSVQNLYLD